MATRIGDVRNNALTGTAGNDTVLGLQGNDTIQGLGGSDLLVGGMGNDLILYGAGPSDVGSSLIFGSEGADTITSAGDAGSNTILGGTGNATIDSQAGGTGDGNDVINASADTGNDLILGNFGDDAITVGGGQNTVLGGMGDDVITAGNGPNLLYGGEGADTITAGNGNNTVVGGTGNSASDNLDGADYIVSGSGNDLILGNGGDDTVAAGSGSDTVLGGYGNDVILGQQGDDILLGNQGDDTLVGGMGDDTLIGGQGNDVLIGGEGNNLIVGGEGIDTAVYADPRSAYTITQDSQGDFIIAGQTGTDTVASTEYFQFSDGTVGASALIQPPPSGGSPTPAPAADLAIAATVSNPTPFVGRQVIFTDTLTDDGPNDATGVSVQDLLPAGLAFVSAMPSTGSYDPTTGAWTVGTVASGTSATLSIEATVTSPDQEINTASIAHSDQPDPDPENDTASATVQGSNSNTWLGTASDDWTTAANWSGGVPIAGQQVLIPADTPSVPSVVDGETVVADGLTITNQSTIAIAPDGSEATFVLDDGTAITGGSMSVGPGTLDVEAGAGGGGATLYGASVNNAGGTIEVSAQASGAVLSLDDGTQVDGGTLDVDEGGTLAIEQSSGAALNGVTVNNMGTVKVDGEASASTLTFEGGTTLAGGALVIGAVGTLDIESGTAASSFLDGVDVTNTGAITVGQTAAGTVLVVDDGTAITGGTMTIASGATLAVAPDAMDAMLSGLSVTNNGLIDVAAQSSGSLLVLNDGTAITGGTINVGSDQSDGTIEVGEDSATLDGVDVDLSANSTIEIGTPAIDPTLRLADGTAINGGTVDIFSGNTLDIAAGAGSATVTLNGVAVDASADSGVGTIIVENGATLALASSTVTGGTITDGGTIIATGTSAVEAGADGAAASLSDGTVEIGAGATLSLLETGVAASTTISFDATTAAQSVLALDLAQPFAATIAGFDNGDVLDLTALSPAGAIATWTQGANGSGTLTVGSGSQGYSFALQGSFSSDDFLVTADGAGTGTAITFADRWTGPAGAAAPNGDWNTAANWAHGVPTAATTALVDAAGTYTVTIDDAEQARALVLDAASATVSDGAGGALTLSGPLAIEAGTVDLAGGTIAGGSVAVSAGALLEGAGTLATPIANAGTITATGGTLDLAGALSGAGSLQIDSGATLELGGGGQAVTFAGSTGTLALDTPAGFTATIAGIDGKGDVLDLRGFNASGAMGLMATTATTGAGSYNTQTNITTLTVSDPSLNETETFKLLGNYSASTWTISADGQGGIDVVDPPANATDGTAQPAAETAIGVAGKRFVFDPGEAASVVHGFEARGADNDVLSLKGADFGKSIADVLRQTGDVNGSAIVTDPVTGDSIRLAGVSTAELKHKDFTFHA